MPSKKNRSLVGAVLVLICGLMAMSAAALAGDAEKVLYSFCSVNNCIDGENSLAGLIFDTNGNLYGTTVNGGAYGYGSVFELSRGEGGTWTEAALYSFCPGGWPCTDGAYPFYGSLILDAAGNLYGTTVAGGAYQASCGESDCGTVFKLSPTGVDVRTETVLHSFGNGPDGTEPVAGLVFDSAGNLFGTTVFGGAHGRGTAFELTPSGDGSWTETVMHSFCSAHSCADGREPYASLTVDALGNLYGTTYYGGGDPPCRGRGCGIVFELMQGKNGKWTEKVLHAFSKNTKQDGSRVAAGLVFDAYGNLYGTTYGGGIYGLGIVFELVPGKRGNWAEKVLHNFRDNNKDGYNPAAGLILDGDGHLYGTTYGGGSFGGCSDRCGTVFELMAGAHDNWTEKILHSFERNGQDGYSPYGGVILDSAGNLYGTTLTGGTGPCTSQGVYVGCGTVFEITRQSVLQR